MTKRESPTTRKAGGLDFSAIGGKKQRHGSALIGAGVTGVLFVVLIISGVGEFFHSKLVIPAKAGIQKCFAEKAGCPPARA